AGGQTALYFSCPLPPQLCNGHEAAQDREPPLDALWVPGASFASTARRPRKIPRLFRKARAHLLRMLVEPALHRLENVLMLPSRDPSLLAGGAALPDGANRRWSNSGVGPCHFPRSCSGRRAFHRPDNCKRP